MKEVSEFKAYKIIHIDSGKGYVGITCRPLVSRWGGHLASMRKKGPRPKTAITQALIKHGVDAFSFEWVASALSRDALCDLERLLIAQEGTKGPHGYNMTSGGDSGFELNQEVKEKIADALRGRISCPDVNARRAASMKEFWKENPHGKPDGFRETMKAVWVVRRATGTPRAPLSLESKEKIAATKRGKPRDLATHAKLSEAQKKYITEHGNRWLGRKHSDETRAKLVAAHVRRRVAKSLQHEMTI